MVTLKKRLEKLKESLIKQIPEDALKVMHRATEDLSSSGILDRIPKVGDKLSPFDLMNTNGEVVSSGLLLEKGPLVLTFYRGVW